MLYLTQRVGTMTTATVKLVLRKHKRKADGTAPVWLRITANRKSRYLSTGIYLEPRHWNETKQRVRAAHPIAPALNARLQDLLLQASRQALDTPSADAVKTSLNGAGGSLTSYFEGFIDDLDTAGRFWDWKKYRVTLGKLTGCFRASICWDDLDRKALIQFERYLRETCSNNPNTVRKELQRLRRVIRLALRDGALKPEQDPFLTYERPSGKKTDRRKLSMEEISQLESAELEAGTWQRYARDAWVFSFYAGGMRFGDVCCLKVESVQNGRVEYHMLKTGTPVSVPLPERAWQIVHPYVEGKEPGEFVFPFLRRGDDADPVRLRRRISSKNALANRYVKQAAERAGLDNAKSISMHIARHSFADYARTKSGNLYAISKTLGHSSLQITQAYLKSFDQDAVDRLADELWGP